MKSCRALLNPFGNHSITIEIGEMSSQCAQIVTCPCETGAGLLLDEGIAELYWTGSEVYGLLKAKEISTLYIFRDEGKGFIIDNMGEQIALQWH